MCEDSLYLQYIIYIIYIKVNSGRTPLSVPRYHKIIFIASKHFVILVIHVHCTGTLLHVLYMSPAMI